MNALTFLALRRLADGQFHSGEDVARDLGRSRATLSQALKRAPELGLDLFSVRGRGYRLAEPLEFLDAEWLQKQLRGTHIALEIVDEIDSTSTRLLQMAAAGTSRASSARATRKVTLAYMPLRRSPRGSFTSTSAVNVRLAGSMVGLMEIRRPGRAPRSGSAANTTPALIASPAARNSP